MIIGDQIKARRTRLRLSQEEVAKHLGISRRTLSSWETGQNAPRWEDIEALAPILGAFSTSAHEGPVQRLESIIDDLKAEHTFELAILSSKLTQLDATNARLTRELAEATSELQHLNAPRNSKFSRVFDAHGFSQVDVARALEIPAESLSRYVHGRRPWPKSVKSQLVEWFGELLFDEDDE